MKNLICPENKMIEEFLKSKNFQTKIDELAEKYKNKKIIIYGAGITFDIIKRNYDISKLNIIGVADKKFNDGDKYHGYKAYNCETFLKEKPDVVLISVYESEIIERYFRKNLIPEVGDFKYEPLINYPYNERFKSRIDLLKNIYSQDKIKIILGSGGKQTPEGWTSTDVDLLDITEKENWTRFLKKNSIDNLLAEHVFEHLEIEEVKAAFNNIYEYLKRGGVLRFAVPDGYHPGEFYKNLTKPGGTGSGSEDHKLFFNIDLLQEIVDREKFDIIPIEYFDNNGIFHKEKYSLDNGYVSRTADNYPNSAFVKNPEEAVKFYESIPENLRYQFEKGNLGYTSLFVDIVKK